VVQEVICSSLELILRDIDGGLHFYSFLLAVEQLADLSG